MLQTYFVEIAKYYNLLKTGLHDITERRYTLNSIYNPLGNDKVCLIRYEFVLFDFLQSARSRRIL